MSVKTKITPSALKELESKKQELEKHLNSDKNHRSDILTLQAFDKELSEINQLLAASEVVEFSEKEPVMVMIGAQVSLENLRTGDVRDYVIMTRSTANPLKGVISNESPLAQKILGLKLGNTFKFRDLGGQEDTFKIKSIE